MSNEERSSPVPHQDLGKQTPCNRQLPPKPTWLGMQVGPCTVAVPPGGPQLGALVMSGREICLS